MYVRKWTPEDEALLGKMPDRDVAERIGAAWLTVKKRREKLGIPAHESQKPRERKDTGRLIGDAELNAALDELKPFLVQEFNRRGVPVRDVDDRSAIQFLLNQALSAAKKDRTRALYQAKEGV